MNDKISKDMQIVTFYLQDQEFGIEINYVREIVRMINVTSLPTTTKNMIVGVINLRGQIIPILSLTKLFDFSTTSVMSKNSRIVVVEFNKVAMGMIVDKVPQVLKISKDNIESTPEIIQQKMNLDFIQGVGKLGNRLIFILDLARLLQPYEHAASMLKKDEGNG